jgi:hypothetical protein
MAGGIFGNLIEEAILGRKNPQVPNAPKVDPQVAQRQSISGNQAALPGSEELAGDVNQFNVDQRRSMLGADYWKLKNQGDSVLGSWLGGQLSPDVGSAIRRGSNVRAQSGGYGYGGPGSMKDYLEGRDIGRGADEFQARAMGILPGYMGATTAIQMPKQFDPVAEFISPGQQMDAQQWNEENRFKRDWLNNQMKALPDPLMAALANTVGNVADPTSGAMILIGDIYGGGGKPASSGTMVNWDDAWEMGSNVGAGAGAGAAASGGGY